MKQKREKTILTAFRCGVKKKDSLGNFRMFEEQNRQYIAWMHRTGNILVKREAMSLFRTKAYAVVKTDRAIYGDFFPIEWFLSMCIGSIVYLIFEAHFFTNDINLQAFIEQSFIVQQIKLLHNWIRYYFMRNFI